MGMGFAMASQMAESMSKPAPAQETPQETPQPAPPPAPAAGPQYWLAVDGQRTGPYDNETIQRKITAGEVSRESLVWTAGMADWSGAGDVAGLADLFSDVPPPLPPQT